MGGALQHHWLIVIATVPGALFGYFLEDYAETVFRSPPLIAGALFIIGAALYLVDKHSKHAKSLTDLTKKDALFIRLSQAVAVIPGVSRAGSTIATGLFLGLDRSSAARFSFLMSAPIILGAVGLKFPDFISSAVGPYEIVAVGTAAASGYFAISWLLKFIEKGGYKLFFWYRLALALIIISLWVTK